MKDAKVTTGTKARTIVLFISIINQLLLMAGKNPLPFSENEIYEAISLVAWVVSSIVCWWKNNSFTVPAILADKFLKEKRG